MVRDSKSDSLTVIESFVGLIDGEDRYFRAGDLIRADDPAAKKWPQFFGTANYPHELRIESATAAPGEQRGSKVS